MLDHLDVSTRRVVGAVVTVATSIGAPRLFIHGLDLSFSLCALGGCAEPENAALGVFLMVAALVIVLAVLTIVPRLAGSSHVVLRAVTAIPASLVAGLLVVSVFGDQGPFEYVALLAMIATAAAVLVPPRMRHENDGTERRLSV